MSVLVYLITEVPFVIGYGLPGNERGFLEVLAIPLFVFFAGYVGAERLWYRRAWEERPFGPSLAWRASWGYVARYLRLGVFALLILVLFDLPWLATSHPAATGGTAYVVSGAIGLLFFDFIGTFMTPALAYTTRSARKAIRIGLSVLRRTLPSSAPYVFIPPLALVLGTRLIPIDNNLAAIVIVGIFATLLNLLLKGATAAFYLRVAPAADWDAEPGSVTQQKRSARPDTWVP